MYINDIVKPILNVYDINAVEVKYVTFTTTSATMIFLYNCPMDNDDTPVPIPNLPNSTMADNLSDATADGKSLIICCYSNKAR